MFKKYIVFFIITILCLSQCTYRIRLKATLNRISIIYIIDWHINQAPKIATLIKTEQKINPGVVIVSGEIFSKSPITDFNKGLAEIELLNNCQIDAVLLTPDFLRWGFPQSKELIRKSNFSCLSANIKDKATNQALGQEYLFKTLEKAHIAILGISYDSLNYYFQDKNLEYRNPDFIILKLLPLLKDRTDFQFVLTRTQDLLDLPVDFILGAPTKNNVQLLPTNKSGIFKLEIIFDDMKNIIELKRAELSIDTLSEDSITKSIINQYQSKTDSILNIKFTNIKIHNFNGWAIKTIQLETKTLGILSDVPLVNKNPATNDILMADLYNELNEKNNLPILTIKGKELRKFSESMLLPVSKISNDTDYKILSTLTFLNEHPEIKFESVEFSNLAVWEILCNNLK